jgi:hypothetical protein
MLAWLGGAVTTDFSGFFVGFLCVQQPNIRQDPLVASMCVKCCRVPIEWKDARGTDAEEHNRCSMYDHQ